MYMWPISTTQSYGGWAKQVPVDQRCANRKVRRPAKIQKVCFVFFFDD